MNPVEIVQTAVEHSDAVLGLYGLTTVTAAGALWRWFKKRKPIREARRARRRARRAARRG